MADNPPIHIPSIFKMVFWTVLCLTLLSLIIMAWIAGTTGSISDATKLPVLKKGLYDVCSVTWQMGFGAIIGLIGGKATEVVQQYQKPPAGQE